jgi:signal transduction histidine kinase
MIIARAKLVHRLLLAVWVIVIVWQVLEHHRVKDLARSTVIRRARDITSTLGLVIRSQRRFGGIVSQPRLESALKELVKSDELKSVALLNAAREVVVSAGEPVDLGGTGIPQSGVRWDKTTVTVVDLVDLGANLQQDSNSPPTIVMPEPEPGRRPFPDRQRFPPPGPRPAEIGSTNVLDVRDSGASTNSRPEFRGPPEGRPRFRRPPWMNEQEFKSLTEKQGLHGLAMVISTDAFRAACTQDLWLRIVIGGFAAVAAIGFGLAWQNLVKSSEFQMRLVRASEMNSHLREMNVAAAGLAHETRNPLNIIRGLAQMISKAPVASDEIQKKSLEITNEVDRVTVQLNEFINYSKPREVRRSPVPIGTVLSDVVRALKSDLEDKAIKLDLVEENLTVNADQQLLRQVLFNLLINAIQAVDTNGRIQIVTHRSNAQEACFEVRDDGPGVPADQRKDIFRPYFTTRDKGTGLGLAVVKQIVMVHGWEVECLPNDNQGALFRVSRLELIPN